MNLNDKFMELMDSNFSSEEKLLFIKSISNITKKHIRYNPFKTVEQPTLKSVPWCEDGYTLEHDKVFTTDPLFHAGVYYVQEASSMYLEEVFKKIIFSNISSPKVLDLCAAPGGKSTHISSMLGRDGVLVANEVIKSRANILKENIIKWGIGNTVVTNSDPKCFGKLKGYFDVIVADVPCSGEGMFRKSEKARLEWSMDNVSLCKSRSGRIIADVWDSLAVGGYLVFSTCTFNRIENEGNIEWLCEHFDVERVDIPLSLYDEKITMSETSKSYGYRFYPHKVDSEGYFVSILKKGGTERAKNKNNQNRRGGALERVDKSLERGLTRMINDDLKCFSNYNNSIYYSTSALQNCVTTLLGSINILHYGIEVCEVFGKKLRPSHSLSQYAFLSLESFNRVEVDLDTALDYLRRKSILHTPFIEGYNLVCYRGHNLGFVNRISNRVNNLYSKASMILHL